MSDEVCALCGKPEDDEVHENIEGRGHWFESTEDVD